MTIFNSKKITQLITVVLLIKPFGNTEFQGNAND